MTDLLPAWTPSTQADRLVVRMERVAAHNRDYFKVDKDVTGMTTKITTLDTVNREVNELSICTDKANEFEYHLRVVTSNKPIVISGDDVRSIAELTRFIADLEDRAVGHINLVSEISDGWNVEIVPAQARKLGVDKTLTYDRIKTISPLPKRPKRTKEVDDENAPNKTAKPAKADKTTREPRTREWTAMKPESKDKNIPWMIDGHMSYWMQDVVGMKSYHLSMDDLKKSLHDIGILATCQWLDRVIDKALADKTRDEKMEVIPAVSPETIVHCPDCASIDLGICEIVYENVKYQIVCLTCGTITNPNGKVIPYEMYHSNPTEKAIEEQPVIIEATAAELATHAKEMFLQAYPNPDWSDADRKEKWLGFFGKGSVKQWRDKGGEWEQLTSYLNSLDTFAVPVIPKEDFDVPAEPEQPKSPAQEITPDGEIIPQETYAATAGTDKLVPSALLAEIKTLTGIPVGEIGAYMNRRHPKGAYRDTQGKNNETWTDLDPIAARIRIEKIFGTMGIGWRIVPIPGLSSITHIKEDHVSAKGKPYTTYTVIAIGFVMEYAVIYPNGDMVYVPTSTMSDSCEIDDLSYTMRGIDSTLQKHVLRSFGGNDHFTKKWD